MSAPRVVNTVDGMVWKRREGTRDGEALYALADAPENCPEFVMATYAELEGHGIAGSADVLPVPVGPEPQAPRPIAYAAKNTDLLLADAAERSRAAEWPWDMWCRICHIRPTSHRTEAEALEAADRHVKLEHASQAEVHKLMAAGGLSELVRLRARVAELETGNAALQKDKEYVAGFAERAEARVNSLAAAVKAARAVHVKYPDSEHCQHDSEPWPCPTLTALGVDGITRRIAPTQALREDEPAHLAPCRWPSSPDCVCHLIEPTGCEHCGLPERGHAQQWKPPVGWHAWVHPTDGQIKARMLARRAARKGGA